MERQKNQKTADNPDLAQFSGVFGVFDRTQPLETGSAGFADRNFAVPNNPDFSYQTASGTKGFTAAAVLSLAAEKKICLEESVREILEKSGYARKSGSPEWLSGRVTVRSLLSHTSGVPDYFDEDLTDDFEDALRGTPTYHYEKPEDFFPLAEAVWKKQEKPYAQAGSFKYSNGGFVVLAAVVEAVSGESFRDYVTGHILEPAGMRRSGFFRLDEPAPAGITRATAYRKNGRSNIFAVPVIGGGDGGAYTNPSDMACFWTMLDPETNPGNPAARLVEEAWTPANEGDGNLYGLGFWISAENPRLVFLEGFDPGVQFFSYYNRDTKRSLTICLNDEAMNCDGVFRRYFAAVKQSGR